jgi:glycosyltransferase involved in cell wall biosynthesis
MKIAIIHDDLMRRGGGEQVALCFHKAFPEATFYTSAYQPHLTYSEFKKVNIVTSWYQNLVKSEKAMKWLFFPFGLLAVRQLKVEGYDVVLISTTYSSKLIPIPSNSIVITYCHTPFRLVWNPNSYSQYTNSKFLFRWLTDRIINYLRKLDKESSKRTNFFIANTEEVKERIIKAYEPLNDIEVIFPPVNLANYYISENIGEYYLVVSRLEHYKKVDLVIDAFNLIGKKLIIVGNGSKKEELMKRAKSNITFMQSVDANSLSNLYAECKAFIFPQNEDFGITPLEANAAGRPVIAFGAGGILDTMIPYAGDASVATALLFEKQEVDDLIEAITKAETLNFSPEFIRANAERFQEKIFIEKVQNFVHNKFKERKLFNTLD